MTDHSELKRLAGAATPQDFDSAETKSENGYIECPCCSGEGAVDLESEYCNYDNVAIGVQFYGIGNEFGAAEAFYRAANPASVLALIAEVDQLKAEVARSTEREIMQLDEIEALRKELASLKSPAIRTDKTTIGYTGCIVCGEYTGHSGLQCPNLAARSLSMENQRIVPVEQIRVSNPLGSLSGKGDNP